MKEILLRSIIEKSLGKQAIPIIEVLLNKKDVSENILFKKTKIPLNEIRNILYKLSAEGLVSFIRKKDRRKGWFIYFWSLNEEKLLLKIENEQISELDNLKKQLEKRKKDRFFKCEICKTETNEENALEKEFVCPECGNPYLLVDNTPFILEIQKNIQRKERILSEIQNEIKLLKEKEEKLRERKHKKKACKKKIKTKKRK